MKPPNEKQAASKVAELLGDLLGCRPTECKVQRVGTNKPYDYVISAAGRRFIAVFKSNAAAGSIAAAIPILKQGRRAQSDAEIPLVVVPCMGRVGRQLCNETRISWLDLSGNAKIEAPGVRIWIEGRPNKYSQRGRPPNVFASKSSRIVRQLLFHPQQFQHQADLVRQTGLGDGYVSKIVRRLADENYLQVNERKAVRPRDPNLLLDAWHDACDFNRHRIIKGHIPTRSGEESLQRVVEAIGHERLEWAATGLSAAWLYTKHAAFRLATVYLSLIPSLSFLKRIEFADEPKGANLWLVLPDDEGVFHGSQTHEGVPCVSPLQTYLDLKGHPERAQEAAAELRKKCLKW